jgi:TPR repeat protein
MSRIAVVASQHDAQFARAVLSGLPDPRPEEISSATALPRLIAADVVVLLIWSSALDREAGAAGGAIDVKALVDLWSQDRLVVARRDESPLPLGMRDLKALDPDADAGAVCRALLLADQARPPSGGDKGAVPPLPVNQRKGRFPSPVAIAGALAAAMVLGGGTWYYLSKAERERQAVLAAALAAAARSTEELKQAQGRQLEALKALELARTAEEAARKAGEPAGLEAAREAARRAEAEVNRQTALVRSIELSALRARADASVAMSKSSLSKSAKAEAPVPATVPAATAPAQVASAAPGEATEKSGSAGAKADPVPQISRHEREYHRQEAAPQSKPVAKAPVKAPASPRELLEQGRRLESEGKYHEAVRAYRLAARKGSGPAAKRLGEIYDRGLPGITRDLAESLQWYEAARLAGEAIPPSAARGGGSGTVIPRPAQADPQVIPEAEKAVAKPTPAETISEARKAVAKPAPTEVVPAVNVEAARQMATERSHGWWALLIGTLALLLAAGIYLWRRPTARGAPAQGDVRGPSQTRQGVAHPPSSTLFVSYSHKDKARVEPIVTQIESMGRQVWMDRTSITGQAGWAGQIVRAIRESRAVVLMASPNSYASDQVVRELYLAMNHRKPIVPIEIEPADLPDELQYILAPYQHHRLSSGDTRSVLGRALAAI